MAEFIVNSAGTVPYGGAIPLITSKGCNKGYIIHREGSGIITLRGIATNPCQRFVRYLVMYSGNIAVPEGGTAGEIALGIAVSGEVENGTIAKTTPAAPEEFFSVSSMRYIDVPVGMAYNIAIENATISGDPLDYDENVSVSITRVA